MISFKNLFFLVFSLAFFLSCGNKNFYSYNMDRDYCRLPICEPVELLSYDRGTHWFIKFPYKTIQGYHELNYIEEIAFKDSILLLKANDPGFTFNGVIYNPAWLAINFKTKTEKIIVNENDFRDMLNALNLDCLKDINLLFEEFEQYKDINGEWHLEKLDNVSK